jgi:hypothetical protein
MLAFATTTALGALTGGFAIARLSQRSRRIGGQLAPRALAIALACAALFIGLRPLYFSAAELSPTHPQHAPACH